MKNLRRIISVTLSFAMMLSVSVTALAQNEKPLNGKTVIIHTNDIHGHFEKDDDHIGITSVAGYKKHLQDEGADVILLDAGDVLHGTSLVTLEKGKAAVKLMNVAGYDAFVPGNHDFNYGTERLMELSKLANFDTICCNVTTKSTDVLKFAQYTIIEKDGIKYGVFGISTPETAYKTNPKNVENIEFKNPIDYAKKAVDVLKQEKCDYIIALSHLGLDEGSEFKSNDIAYKVPGIDIIIDGHSHTKLDSGKVVNGVLISQTGEHLKNLGTVTIDKQTKKVSAKLVPVSELKNYSDSEVDKTFESIEGEQKKILDTVIGKTSVTLDGEREHVRKGETNLGNLICDALLKETNADVVLTNGGGIRATIKAGDITKGDVLTVLPFGNYGITKDVKGSDILAMLEHGVKDYPATNGGFLHIAGGKYEFDASKPVGERIVCATINSQPIDKSKTYTLATNDFTGVGGDGYDMLKNYPIKNEYSSFDEILMKYINSNNAIPTVENRITELSGSTEEAQVSTSNNVIVYQVASGDSLISIAQKQLGTNDWQKVYNLNKNIIGENPNLIVVGQKLTLTKAS